MANDIRITQDYAGFKAGQTFPEGSLKKVSSYQINDMGRTHFIPKSHCETVRTNSSQIPADPLGNILGGPTKFGTVQAPASPKPKPKKSLGDNQVYLTDFTDGKLPTSGIDHIIDQYPEDEWEEEFRLFIPEFDSNYVWNANCLEACVLGKALEERVLLTGPPGTGKTTAHEQFAHILRQPFFAVNGKDGMEPSSFIGSIGPDGKGGWQWADGTVPMCMKIGAYLCIDEVWKLPAGIQMTMQSVYQKGGHIVLDDKPGTLSDKLVKPDKRFHLCASDNVKGVGDNFGMFGATQIQDTSSLDRFGITYELDYMPENQESELLEVLFPGLIDTKVIPKLVQVANLIREAYKAEDVALTFSNRGLRSCCSLLDRDIPPALALELTYLGKLASTQEIEAVQEFIDTCGLR